KLDALRKDFTESILQDIISKKQLESQSKDQQENIKEEVITDTTHQTMEPPDPQATNEPPISSQVQINEEIEKAKLDESVKDTQIEEIQATMEEELVAKPSNTTDTPTSAALEALHIISIPSPQPPQGSPQQIPTAQVAEDILNLNKPPTS